MACKLPIWGHISHWLTDLQGLNLSPKEIIYFYYFFALKIKPIYYLDHGIYFPERFSMSRHWIENARAILCWLILSFHFMIDSWVGFNKHFVSSSKKNPYQSYVLLLCFSLPLSNKIHLLLVKSNVRYLMHWNTLKTYAEMLHRGSVDLICIWWDKMDSIVRNFFRNTGNVCLFLTNSWLTRDLSFVSWSISHLGKICGQIDVWSSFGMLYLDHVASP